jgi:uncharacterized membrane protein YdjX (TVP38/TMEM64 family)
MSTGVSEDSEKVAGATAGTIPSLTGRVATIVKRLGPAGPLALLAGTMPAIGGFAILFVLNWVGPWLKAHEEAGVLLYVTGFAVMAGLAILPTYAQSVLGGWAFGFAVGCPAALGGVLSASLIGYVIGRRASGERVVRLIEEQPKWKAVYRALLGSGFWKALLIVTLVRIPPSSPFAMTNLVLAAMRVRPLEYVIGTVIGLSPRTAAVVFVAAGLKELVFEHTPLPKWMLVGGIVATFVVIGVIGYMANRAIAAVTGADAARPGVQP